MKPSSSHSTPAYMSIFSDIQIRKTYRYYIYSIIQKLHMNFFFELMYAFIKHYVSNAITHNNSSGCFSGELHVTDASFRSRSKEITCSYKSKCSSPQTKKPTNGSYPESVQSSLHLLNLFLYISF